MKKFLIKILIFSLAIGCVAFCADMLISYGIRQTDSRKYAAWNDIYNEINLNADIVVIGASSAWSSYNTHIIDSVLNLSSYNLGIDGHPFVPCQSLRYNTYLRHSALPKYMIINIDIGTLGVLSEPYEREQFFPYFNDDSLVSQISSIKGISLIERHCPLIRYYGYREEIELGIYGLFGMKPYFDGGMYKGFRGNEYKWDRAFLKTKKTMEINWEKECVDSLIYFIKENQKRGISVVLSKNPMYFELQNVITNIDDANSLYDSIAKVVNVNLLDYWESDISKDSSYFYNSTHLNKIGAKKFTLQLTHDLDSLEFFNNK